MKTGNTYTLLRKQYNTYSTYSTAHYIIFIGRKRFSSVSTYMYLKFYLDKKLHAIFFSILRKLKVAGNSSSTFQDLEFDGSL